ncbi:hypothetical protein [Nocardia cyriacigeorgica]|uniref:hypothetical protein n=1 Tax=Nocardia cyriacigeorgica TaxID=135487 RepID=UPI002453F39D|nr:hypothetical protein [Nocardia cyriacigeorgica]
MTTPTIPAGVQHTGTPQAPQPFGLYTAATVIDLDPPARMLGGVHWTPSNCGPSGTWDVRLCDDPQDPPTESKTGARPDDAAFPTVTVWATDECELYATDTSANEARATQLLTLHERLWVEQAFALELAARATALPAAGSLAEAVGALEQQLGLAGFTGVLHARRGLAAPLHDHIERSGAFLTTSLGNRWSFGGGYNALGQTLYATGPVTLWRSPATTRTAVEHTINERQAVAERQVAFGWECPTTVFSVAVTG